MSESSETRGVKPPTWMTRREKKLFNSVKAARNLRNLPLKEDELTVLIDYVRTASRSETLQAIFWDDDQRMRSHRDASVKARLVATCRQIDASTKLACGLLDRLMQASNSPATSITTETSRG